MSQLVKKLLTSGCSLQPKQHCRTLVELPLSAKSSRSIVLGTMSRVVAMPCKGRKDVIPAAPSHTKLLLHQRWKLWLLGLMFTIAGLLEFGGVAFGAYFGAPPSLVSLGGTVIAMAALLTGFLVLRCPKCHLSLLWHAVSTKPPGAWLGWLLDARTCPRCGFAEAATLPNTSD